MNEQDITNEVTYRKHPLHEWDVDELDMEINRFKFAIQNSPFKVVVALCIYNEEQFIEQTLDDLIKIKDIDAIHILDGAWEGGGDSTTSSDGTHSKIIQWITKNNMQVTVERQLDRNIFKSEGDKRNYQLQRIEKLYGQCYVIVHDGDEEMRFNCGKDQIFLKEQLAPHWPRTIIMKSYAYNGVNGHIGVRVIPTGQGVHYHTDKAMLVHDKNCNIICDYNFDKTSLIQSRETRDFDLLFFVNKWNIRNTKRAQEKDAYVEQVFSNKEPKKCQYKPL